MKGYSPKAGGAMRESEGSVARDEVVIWGLITEILVFVHKFISANCPSLFLHFRAISLQVDLST